jgi:flagellar motor switch protein FliM
MPANLQIANTDHGYTSGDSSCEPLVPGQLGQEAVERATQIHSAALKRAGAALSELLQVPVSMTLREAAQAPFSTLFSERVAEDHVIVLSLSPLQGYGFLTFPKLLLFRILDNLLATPDTSSEKTTDDESHRSVTGIELHVLQEFFEVFTNSLRESWEPFYPVAFSQVFGDESHEQRAGENGDAPALKLHATLDLAGITADIVLAVPVFLPRLAGLSGAPASRSTAPGPGRESIFNCLSGARVRVDGVLDGASIRIRNLLDLQPDQILVLRESEGAPVSCLVNSRRAYTGELTVSRGRYAIQVDVLTGSTASTGSENQFTVAPVTDK